MLRRASCAVLLLCVLSFPLAVFAATIDFEDVGAGLPIGGHFFYNGSSAPPGASDFVSGGATFHNDFSDFGGGCCWQGFAYSQATDTTTPGFGNQHSAYAGGGAGGSATYAVGFTGGAVGATGVSTIDFGADVELAGAFFTNTTYAALSMRDGDAFAKKFGGVSGDDPDYLKLSIRGLDGVGAVIGTVEFYLADFRSADHSQDYIVGDWRYVDLSGLGPVHGLDFSLESSDTSFGFLDTPAYFALDDLVVVPEPASAALLALGLGALARLRRRTRARMALPRA